MRYAILAFSLPPRFLVLSLSFFTTWHVFPARYVYFWSFIKVFWTLRYFSPSTLSFFIYPISFGLYSVALKILHFSRPIIKSSTFPFVFIWRVLYVYAWFNLFVNPTFLIIILLISFPLKYPLKLICFWIIVCILIIYLFFRFMKNFWWPEHQMKKMLTLLFGFCLSEWCCLCLLCSIDLQTG